MDNIWPEILNQSSSGMQIFSISGRPSAASGNKLPFSSGKRSGSGGRNTRGRYRNDAVSRETATFRPFTGLGPRASPERRTVTIEWLPPDKFGGIGLIHGCRSICGTQIRLLGAVGIPSSLVTPYDRLRDRAASSPHSSMVWSRLETDWLAERRLERIRQKAVGLNPCPDICRDPAHGLQEVLVVLLQIAVEYRFVMRDPVSKLSQVVKSLLHCPAATARKRLVQCRTPECPFVVGFATAVEMAASADESDPEAQRH